VEEFFGSILAATFKTSDPVNMKKFLGIYLNAEAKTFDAKWQNQEQQIIAIMRDDAFGAKRVPVGELHKSTMPTCGSHSNQASTLRRARQRC